MAELRGSSTKATSLPPRWVKAPIGEIFSVLGGGTPDTSRPELWDGTIPWATSADIDEHGKIASRRGISEAGLRESATNRVPAGSVVVVTRVGLGKVGLAESDLSFSQDCQALLFLSDLLLPKFVAFQMQTAVAHFKFVGRGTTISGVTKRQLLDTEFLIAPLSEQRRIVAEIEKQLTRLDTAVTLLKRVDANLKRYRASVLTAASTGRLVPVEANMARAEGRTYESGEQLLDRILRERRARWETSQLENMNRQGTTPRDDRWKSKYREPGRQDFSGRPLLPEGWIWCSVGQVFEVCVGATPSRARPDYWSGGINWVSSGEVAFCRIKETRERITEAGLQNSSTAVHPAGTVLLGMIGEGRTRGQVAILDVEAANNQNSAAIRVSQAGLPPEFVYRFFESQYDNVRRISRGNNQLALNKTRVEAMPLPLPPAAEQYRIVAEIERRLSIVDELETWVSTNIKRAARLRQAMLKRAFDGRLVPQDPDDKSASILLERIRASRMSVSGSERPVRSARKRNVRIATE